MTSVVAQRYVNRNLNQGPVTYEKSCAENDHVCFLILYSLDAISYAHKIVVMSKDFNYFSINIDTCKHTIYCRKITGRRHGLFATFLVITIIIFQRWPPDCLFRPSLTQNLIIKLQFRWLSLKLPLFPP